MDGVKIIDISSSDNTKTKSKKKLTKKQMYKEILSSSDTVKEIINNRKKTRRFDYLNTIPTKTQELHQESSKKSTELPKQISTSSSTQLSKTNIVQSQGSIKNYFKVQETPKPPPPPAQETTKKPSKQSKPILKKKKKSVSFKTVQKQPINTYFKPSSENINTENIPKIENPEPKLKPKPKPILKTIKKISQPKRFTESQIVEIIKILVKLNKLEHLNKIHKTIRRLNTIQTNQLLFALRLIRQYSNAPVNMLKTTLFNYITGDVCVVR